ncbi:hypothetical protein TVAG_208610 [Trichomonas vaginalis G3]|uniref:Uncharacterized protein n=1 Tax=Trichomonas vaginalis (strain ATCC PRA-98 / G3) TaxID=412133 RepID=A2F361_TRIV3|nr:hypothetical protein TVAGG3_0950560 [Trichomonas vaginalis G3]EAY00669.1 hypothetical protein TVAG_208610 [Trichomonas vaginalis G3]KAI5487191.1 hypothetical protein TVAGG3_0950560 [Trichomonas vaginalis G3]|eukprot:XP_001313598.1 hypothetical protein [Trichomonas vaginalis G3]
MSVLWFFGFCRDIFSIIIEIERFWLLLRNNDPEAKNSGDECENASRSKKRAFLAICGSANA